MRAGVVDREELACAPIAGILSIDVRAGAYQAFSQTRTIGYLPASPASYLEC